MNRRFGVFALAVLLTIAGCGSNSSDGAGNSESKTAVREKGIINSQRLSTESVSRDGAEGSFVSADSISVSADDKTAAPVYSYHLFIDRQFDSVEAGDGSGMVTASTAYDLLETEPDRDAYGEPAGQSLPRGVQSAAAAINADTKATSGTFLSANREKAEKFYDSHKDDEGWSGDYSDENYLTVIRADSRCLSVIRNRTQHLGEASEYEQTSACSFDAATGKRLEIGDVMSGGNLASLLAGKLLEKYEKDDLGSDVNTKKKLEKKIQALMDGDEEYEGDNDLHYVIWYVERGGITFILNRSDLTSDDSEHLTIKQFQVSLTDGDGDAVLNQDYIDGSESYVQAIPVDEDYDLDGRTLHISPEKDEYDTVQGLKVTYGDRDIAFEAMGYDPRAYCMVVPSGKFLYIDLGGDNDWHSLYTVHLEEDTLEMKEVSEMLEMKEPQVDPEHMLMATTSSLLSTLPIDRSYHVDSDSGLPVANEKYFHVMNYGKNSVTLTLRQDANLQILDSLSGDSTHEESVKKGTTMQFYRTDNDTIADCIADDGRCIRFTVDVSAGWPQKIDGKYTLEDLLDGTVFAG